MMWQADQSARAAQFQSAFYRVHRAARFHSADSQPRLLVLFGLAGGKRLNAFNQVANELKAERKPDKHRNFIALGNHDGKKGNPSRSN